MVFTLLPLPALQLLSEEELGPWDGLYIIYNLREPSIILPSLPFLGPEAYDLC